MGRLQLCWNHPPVWKGSMNYYLELYREVTPCSEPLTRTSLPIETVLCSYNSYFFPRRLHKEGLGPHSLFRKWPQKVQHLEGTGSLCEKIISSSAALSLFPSWWILRIPVIIELRNRALLLGMSPPCSPRFPRGKTQGAKIGYLCLRWEHVHSSCSDL